MKHALLVAAVVVLVCGVASGEIPQVLGYQGRITDNSGNPVADGTYTMRCRIYDDETGGTLLWDSNDDSVVVAGGAFSVMLGESPHPTLSLAFDEDYWLLVTFDGEDQVPRKRLGSVGYAYMASGIVPGTEMVDSRNNPIFKGTNLGTGAGLRGDSDQGDGVRGQSSATDGKGVYGQAIASTGINYGVYGETSSPSGWGVFGTASATTGSTYGGRFESSSSTYGRGVFAWAKGTTGQGVGVYGVSSSPSGYAVLGEADATTGTNYAVYGKTNSTDGYGGYFDGRGYFSGNVGIGTATPGAKLDVRGRAIFNEDGADSDFRVEGDTNENLVFVDADSNRVGIGTGAPNATLDVRGSAVFNEDGDDVDFRVEGDTKQNLIFASAGQDRVGICAGTPEATLDVRGSAVFNYDYGDNDFRIAGDSEHNLLFCDASAGRVCIGTSSPYDPQSRLVVRDGNIEVGWGPFGYMGVKIEDSEGIFTYGPSETSNCEITHIAGDYDRGAIRVCDDEGIGRAGMRVNLAGDGIVWGDTKNFRMTNPNEPDTEIWYACIEGPEAAAYLRGTARLENGHASVIFPDHFQAVATAEGMTVQLTPCSAESEGLAVTQRSVNGIEVRELRNGTGTYDFDYTVMAVRKGYEDYQVIRPAWEEEPTEPPPAPGT